jgi:hypothetical protein
MKQLDALLPFTFNAALKYSIRNIQDNKEGMELKGTHQLLAYADCIN